MHSHSAASMSDIKSVLSLLCQHLNLSINVILKPEYFRLAKFDDNSEAVTDALWTVLDILSSYVVEAQRISLDLQEYKKDVAVKLKFACLEYQGVEFYALSRDGCSNRQLLLAFAWLLGSYKALNTVIERVIANSSLGREFSPAKTSDKGEPQYDIPKSLSAQANHILHLSGKLNYNLKEIYELVSERAKLMAKVHAASMNISGLPHLSVLQLALVKNLCTTLKGKKKDTHKQLQELNVLGSLLEIHMKWEKKETIFFDWMVSVIEEYQKTIGTNISDKDLSELLHFLSLLHYEIKKMSADFTNKGKSHDSSNQNAICTSRFLRIHSGTPTAIKILQDTNSSLNEATKELLGNKEEILKELKFLLRLIPACVQI